MRKGLWSPDEDEKLKTCVAQHRRGSWSDIARRAGLQRCGKSCRRRWMNHLRPDLKQEKFTSNEVKLVTKLHERLGNKWSKIAAYLVGRSDNDVKNLWNTQIKRQKKSTENQLGLMIDNSKHYFPFSIDLNNESMGNSILENLNYHNGIKCASSTITSIDGVDSDQHAYTSHSIDALAIDLSNFYGDVPNVNLIPLEESDQLVSSFYEESNLKNSSFCKGKNLMKEPSTTTNFEFFFNFDTPVSLMMERNLDSMEHNESNTSYNHILEGTSTDESSDATRSIIDDGCSVHQSSLFELSFHEMEVVQHIVLDF